MNPSPEAEHSRTLTRDVVVDLARLVALIFAIIVVVRTTARLGHVVSLLLLAVCLAFLSGSVRSWLSRHVRPGMAGAVTALLSFAGLVVLGYVITRDLTSQSRRLAEVLTGALDDLRPGSLPARVARVVHAREGVESVFGRLPTSVVVGKQDASGVGRQVADLFVVVVLAAFLQGTGGRVVDWSLARWPRSQRRVLRERWNDITIRAGALVRRSMALALVVAVATAGACALFGLPGGVVIGAWAGAWAPVPFVGPFVGLAPLAIVGTAESDTVALGVALTTVSIAAFVVALRRKLERTATMRPGPAVWVLAYAAGHAIGNLAGVFVAVTALAIVSAILTGRSQQISGNGALRTKGEEPEVAAESTDMDSLGRGVVRLFVRHDADEWWRSVLTVRGVAVLAATSVVATLAWMLLAEVGALTAWVVVGLLLAVALDRPVSWLSGRVPSLARVAAVACVLAIAGIAVSSTVLVAVRAGTDRGSGLTNELPRAVERLERAPVIGKLLRDREAATWVRTQVQDLPNRFSSDDGPARWLPTIGGRLVDLFWTLLIGVALVVDGPRLAAAVRRRLPVQHRRQFVRLVDVAHAAVSGYLVGAATVALLNAAVVLLTAASLGISLAPALAAWAFVCNFIPQIGGFLGGFPLVVLAMASGPTQALIAAGIFISYQLAENHLIQPAVISKAIDIPPITALLAALAGGAADGLVGAIVLTPLVGVIKVVTQTYRRDDFPGRVAVSAERAQPTSSEAVVAQPVPASASGA